ncbi:MAG: lipoyl(octanoyl) transferase LipB [Motiliproteus sp.]
MSGSKPIQSTVHNLVVRQLGLQPYTSVLAAMQHLTGQRDTTTDDEIWLVEHPAVFTQGQAGKAEHLLAPGDIEVVKVDRGGQVTYHGPGQLVVYLMLDLKRLKLGVRELVALMEQSVVQLLAEFAIDAYPKADAPGVYVQQASGASEEPSSKSLELAQVESKIASLGLRIRRGCSFHGLALNVDMDLAPFSRINPCGYAGLAMTQMSDLPTAVAAVCSVDLVGFRLQQILTEKLGYNAALVTKQPYSTV